MGEILVAAKHREEAEIHRAHIERGHFGRRPLGRGQAFIERHALPAPGRDVHDGIGALLDPGQEIHEEIGGWRGAAILRFARMQMKDRGAGLAGIDRLFGDFAGRHRQMRRH